ncbi:hypothetical protein V6N13_036156 [Hibiscus sabdariffa]|uniref:Uncharacterized protein n=1 Tax=Hibiscus sabdariffa TaxID=183260 RepID=A0ABR2S825_9ROSI
MQRRSNCPCHCQCQLLLQPKINHFQQKEEEFRNSQSSRLEDIKRNLIDRSQSEILKIQTQACQQVVEEADKKIDGSHEAMKVSYAEFMADAQATASRELPFLSFQIHLRKELTISAADLEHPPLRFDSGTGTGSGSGSSFLEMTKSNLASGCLV